MMMMTINEVSNHNKKNAKPRKYKEKNKKIMVAQRPQGNETFVQRQLVGGGDAAQGLEDEGLEGLHISYSILVMAY